MLSEKKDGLEPLTESEACLNISYIKIKAQWSSTHSKVHESFTPKTSHISLLKYSCQPATAVVYKNLLLHAAYTSKKNKGNG